MHLYERLKTETAIDREYLLSAPVIQRALHGEVTRELYVEFLTQAYHHVRHTVPLLMAVGARLPERHDGCGSRSCTTSRRRPATSSGS